MIPMLADRMLGKLARTLRMIGHDVEYVRDGLPAEISRRAREEGRVLLTRDTRLAAQHDPSAVILIRSNYPFHQAREVMKRLRLETDSSFERCVEDNGLLSRVGKEDVAGDVPPYTLETQDQFFRCARCRRVYWAGTHMEGMRGVISALQGAPLMPAEDEESEEAATFALEPLVDLHHALDVLVLEHRLALMRGQLASAQSTFRRLAIWLTRHMRDEAELVLPRYAAARPAEGWERGSAPELFTAEHDKLRDLLSRLGAMVEGLGAGQLAGDELRVECLRVLDREKVMVDLLEHHDRRERTFLYPTLDRVLSDAEKAELVERMVGLNLEDHADGRQHEG